MIGAGAWSDAARFRARVVSDDLNNFHLLQYRRLDGFLITGKNSGTHWLRYMLGHALAAQFGAPPPRRSSGDGPDVLVGHPKHRHGHAGVPQIGSSHTVPSRALGWGAVWEAAALPKAVVLVRSIPDALRSHYARWGARYGVDFETYLRGDPSGRRFMTDAWWFTRFFNAWGELARRKPDQVLLLRYEDVEANPRAAIARAGRHFGVAFGEAALDAAAAVASRDSVRLSLDPALGDVIPAREALDEIRFTTADRAILTRILGRHLKDDLGYGYLTVPAPVNTKNAPAAIRAKPIP